MQVANILKITHATVVCILSIIQFIRQLLQMYHVTKQWLALNRYLNLLIQQGVFYFFA